MPDSEGTLSFRLDPSLPSEASAACALERFVMRMLEAELTGTEAFCYQQKEDDNTAQRRVLPELGGRLPCPARRAELAFPARTLPHLPNTPLIADGSGYWT